MKQKDNSPIIIDSYQPKLRGKCDVCGRSPTVTGVKDGKVLYDGGMCGPCTWGEARLIDPATWNE